MIDRCVDPDFRSAVGQRLGHAMRVRGWTKQMAFAAEIGVDESVVSRLLKGANLTVSNVMQVSEALDISLDWLLFGRGTIDAHRQKSGDPGEGGLALLLASLPDGAAVALTSLVKAIRDGCGPDRD